MKILIFLCAIFLSLPLLAETTEYSEERPINDTTELKAWCKNKSAEYFLAQDITPYNWTASWWTEGNFLFVKGSWRVKMKKHYVKCRVRKGVAEKYATWEFIEED